MNDSDCAVCRSNEGIERISPGSPVYEGKLWIVEHAYPSSLLGWLVIVLKRHAVALHELSREEAEELGLLQWAVSRALKVETGCLKEYSVFFAEHPRFSHVHVHMVPRQAYLDADLLGGRVFAHLNPTPEAVVAPEAVVDVCGRLSELVSRRMRGEPSRRLQ